MIVVADFTRLGESAAEVAQSWPAVIVALIVTLGGWGTLLIKRGGDSKTVKQIKEQVTNGHDTNLRDEITEGLKLMRFAVDHVRQLPSQNDFARLEGKVNRQGSRLAHFEDRFNRQYPGDGDAAIH